MSNQVIVGGQELDRLLQTLAPNIEKNIMRGALAAGARVLRDEVKSLAPTGPPSPANEKNYGGYRGALKDSVRVSSRVKNGQVLVSVRAGGKGGKSRGADVFYAHMVEFGTLPHGTKKGAKRKSGKHQDGKLHPGMPNQPFMRPAFDNKSGEAIAAIAAHIKKRLTAQGLNTADPQPPEGPA